MTIYSPSSYSSYHSLRSRRFARRRPMFPGVRFGVFALVFLVAILFSGVSLLYLTQFNVSSTKGYTLNGLQHDREDLLQENEVFNLLLSDARALSTIRKSEVVQRMVSVDPKEITYMKKGTAVAKK